jgi:hypothetical protein
MIVNRISCNIIHFLFDIRITQAIKRIVSRIVHFQLKLGIINKELFYIPKHLEDRFDGIHV